MNGEHHIPAARQKDLVVTESGNEILVYDLVWNQIHHLNEVSARVWALCDGRRTVSDIAHATGLSEPVIAMAVTSLNAVSLLDGRIDASLRQTTSRRSLLRRTAAAAVVPTIVSVTAPAAVQAASCDGVNFGPGEVCGTYGPGQAQTNLGRNCCKNPNTGYQPTCQFRQYANCQHGYYDAAHCDAQLACQ